MEVLDPFFVGLGSDAQRCGKNVMDAVCASSSGSSFSSLLRPVAIEAHDELLGRGLHSFREIRRHDSAGGCSKIELLVVINTILPGGGIADLL